MAANSSMPGSPTSAFPTFLYTDPYPSASRDGRPMSSASAATDATSEFGGGDEFVSVNQGNSTVPSVTGAVGEPGLPPSRSLSMASEAMHRPTNRTSLPPSSRRGPPTIGTPSRPSTATSKTHVPSLAAQGFFRPLSSQQLQAQRNQRPTTGNTVGQDPVNNNKIPYEEEEEEEAASRPRRYSNASVNTLRDARSMRHEDVPPLPVSRGTQFTSGDEANNTTSSVTSATPLQVQQKDTSGIRSANAGPLPPLPKSPRSFRASLGLNSRPNRPEAERRPSPGQHHEKLNSNPSSPNLAEREKPPPISSPSKPSQTNAGKNYEYFAGNMLFFLSGRCMNTRARPLNVLTFILTTLPAALFGAFSAPWLWLHVSPAIPIVFAYVFYVTITSFLHAQFSDPGILPRNLHPHPPNPEEERDPLTPGPATTEWVMVKTFPSSHNAPLPGRANDDSAEAADISTTAMEVPTKYCKSCNIWRPPRAHHCRVCDSCIETQDHHCVWLNNCVGRRNYRYFFTYVASGSLLCLMVMAFCLTHVILYAKKHHISFADSLSGRTQERVAFAMVLYAVLALPYPGSLFFYHLFLIARGETTRELLNSHKFLKKDRHRPFSQSSWMRNWISVLVRPRPPTYLQLKHKYQPGDVRFGYMRSRKQRKSDLKNRYSVQGAVDGNGKSEMEMKNLPNPGSRGKLQARSDAASGPGGVGNANGNGNGNGVKANGSPR